MVIVLVALLVLTVFRRYVAAAPAPAHGSVEEATEVLVGDAD